MVIGFHKPEEPNGYLSNWYPSKFEVDGITFTSMEQYMMYKKAIYFKDEEIAQKMLATNSPEEIKALGRLVKNFDGRLWKGICQMVVYEGLKQKFLQNEDLMVELLATKDAILAECARTDDIWGIGLGMDDPRRLDIKEWNGQNLLGFALMMVRDNL